MAENPVDTFRRIATQAFPGREFDEERMAAAKAYCEAPHDIEWHRRRQRWMELCTRIEPTEDERREYEQLAREFTNPIA